MLAKLEREGPLERGVSKAKERILFVDDEEALASMVAEMLGRFGYEVTATTSSLEALADFRTEPEKYDLVITDETMPNMSGAQLAEELMRIRSNIPIVICTGFGETVEPENGQKLGIREYLMKPIRAGDLDRAIRRVLGKATGKEETRFDRSSRCG